jgi:hypothetical protein
MYDAVASSRSAVWVEQLSIAAELCRPVRRTEEAAEWSAPPVSSRASSSLRPADRPNASIDSLVSLPNSDAVFVAVSTVVKMFLQSIGPLARNGRNRKSRHVGLHCDQEGGKGIRPATAYLKRRRLHFLRQYLHLAWVSDRPTANSRPFIQFTSVLSAPPTAVITRYSIHTAGTIV